MKFQLVPFTEPSNMTAVGVYNVDFGHNLNELAITGVMNCVWIHSPLICPVNDAGAIL